MARHTTPVRCHPERYSTKDLAEDVGPVRSWLDPSEYLRMTISGKAASAMNKRPHCLIVASLLVASHAFAQPRPQTTQPVKTKATIEVATKRSALKLFVSADVGRLYQLGYGAKDEQYKLPTRLNRQDEFYSSGGDGFISEPALQIAHADGNTSTSLMYVNHDTSKVDDNVSLTRIELKDSHYPLHVTLCLKTYAEQDVIEQWTEIRHDEAKPIRMDRYHSAAPVLRGREYHLSQFQGDYKREATLVEEKLTQGIKILDSKIGVRATRYRIPSILVSLGQPASEESGEVIGGSLAWPGSFQIALEVDWQN